MFKVLRSRYLKMEMMVGIVESEGIRRAQSLGIRTSTKGIDAILEDDEGRIVFDATTAKAHVKHALLTSGGRGK